MGSGGRALCRQWCSLALLLSVEVHPSGFSVPLCVPLPRDSFCRLLLIIFVPCVEMEASSVSSWVPFRRTRRPVPGRSVGGAGGRRQVWGCLCDPLTAARSPQPRVCPAPASPTRSGGPASLARLLRLTVWESAAVTHLACIFPQRPDQTNSFWHEASSVELMNWLWVVMVLLRKVREGCNLGSRLGICLLVSEGAQVI